LSSWWWAWWCPKHVEQAIRPAIKTSVASSWHFMFHILTTMHGQNHIKFDWQLCFVSLPYTIYILYALFWANWHKTVWHPYLISSENAHRVPLCSWPWSYCRWPQVFLYRCNQLAINLFTTSKRWQIFI